MRLLSLALTIVIVVQAAIGAYAAMARTWRGLDANRPNRLTADVATRIEHTFGEEAAAVELLARAVPAGAVVFVDWPPTFRTDPNDTSVGADAEPILHWLATIERSRLLLYPSPPILRMLPGAFAAAEAMAA
ncbi:MAG: hypothetical protein KDE27_03385, partial [Planctomycetes bacterium]|nr:hypothetical protein [Planctomycetota bacterium]